jgi:hypothetical protein
MRAKRTTSVQARRVRVKLRGDQPDSESMQILFSNRRASWSRVAMDFSGIAFAFSVLLLAAQGS